MNDFKILIQAILDKSKLPKEFEDVQKLADSLSVRIKPFLEKASLQNDLAKIAGQLATIFNHEYQLNINSKDIMSAIKNVTKEQEKFNKTQQAQILREQVQYYNRIEQNLKTIYALKMRLPTAGEFETAEIQKQIVLLEKRNQYNSSQLNKKGLKDESLEWELNRTIDILQKRLEINNAKTVDKNSAKYEKEATAALNKQITSLNKILALKAQLAVKSTTGNANEISVIQQQLSVEQQRYNLLSQESAKYDDVISKEQRRTILMQESANAQNKLVQAQAKVTDKNTRRSQIESENIALKEQQKLQAQLRLELQKTNVKSNIDTFISQNSKLKGASIEAKALYNRFIELKQAIDSVDNSGSLANLKTQLSTLKNEVKSAGLIGKSPLADVKGALAGVTTWISATTIFFRTIRTIRNGISTIYALDTALVDLRKTTSATSKELEDFYYDSNVTAKNLGVTTEEIISQASAWSRLGYSIKDAKTMAENSAIFKSISPGMEIKKSTDGLVSTMKAFKIEADQSLDGIISKINIIGNTQAVDNQDIVDILTRSSSAMAEANNNLEQTIALGTAA